MKQFISGRTGQKICVVVENLENSKGLVFVMHGQGGFKEQTHVQAFARASKDNRYTTVLFDARNTIGESEGNMEDASITSYYEDLEDVINWAKDEKWYQEPFVLAGHSLGGICTALYAEQHPEKVKALAPISTVVSGKLTWDTMPKKELEEFRKQGYWITPSKSKPGVMKKLKWSSMEDRLKYDLLPNADKLIMPILMIVGEKDTSTPLEHQKLLYNKIPGKKEIHIIKNAPHDFYDKEYLDEIYQIFDRWIKSIT